MFITERLIIGEIIHSAIDLAKTNKLKSENAVLPKNIFKIVGTDNAAFYLDNNISSIKEVMTEYKFDDLRPSDIVLDIGANIGGFCLNVNKKVSSVYAVEPIFIDTLNRNIELNNAKNIDIIPCALGSGEMDITYNGRSAKAIGLPLGDIIKLCGGHVDFIKMDCEGAEFCIKIPEIMNIRRIEAEIHTFDMNGKSHNLIDFENILSSAGFDYTKNIASSGQMMIHAKNRYID